MFSCGVAAGGKGRDVCVGGAGGVVGGTRPGRGERKEWDGKCVNDAVFSLSVQTARRQNRQRGKEQRKVYVVCTAVVWPGVQGWGGGYFSVA